MLQSEAIKTFRDHGSEDDILMKYNSQTKAILWILFSTSVFLWFNYLSYISLAELFKNSKLSEAILSLFIAIIISLICGFLILLCLDKFIRFFSPEKKISKKINVKGKDEGLLLFIKNSPATIIICLMVGFFNFAILISAPLMFIDFILKTNLLDLFLSIFHFEEGNFIMNGIKIGILGIPQTYKYGQSRSWNL